MSEKVAPRDESAPARKTSDDPPVCVKCGEEYLLTDGFDPSDYCDPCAQSVVFDLRQALEEISEPIPFMRKRAEAEGGKLNGRMAVSLSDDANFLKAIAREALKKAKGEF